MGRLFGTNGVRGVANQELTPELAMRLGKAIGSWLPPGRTVAVGRDQRRSGPMLASAAVAGLLSAGVGVVRLGIVPTPALQYYVKTHPDVHAGLIITASHNPPEFNGLKVVSGDGTEASRDEEEAVEKRYFDQDFRAASWREIQPVREDGSAVEAYVQGVLKCVDVDRIRKRKFHVALDTGGGVGSLGMLPLLEALGCKVTPLFIALDGEFTGRKSEPTPDNLGRLLETVPKVKADLGVALDGDADRCIFVSGDGTWVSGDQSLALLTRQGIQDAKGGLVCTPVSTGSIVEETVKPDGGKVRYTAVGSPVVAREMMRHHAVIGGEENGGVIFPDHQYCRDGAMAAAKMLDLLSRQDKSLGTWVQGLPVFHVTKSKFPVPEAAKAGLLPRMQQWVKAELPNARVDTTDGLKVYLDRGWVLIRPSGTEPIYRVYCESKDAAWSKATAAKFVEAARTLVART